MRLLTLASLATLSAASSGCWSEVISGRSPGANIVSKGYTHSSSASSAACHDSKDGRTLERLSATANTGKSGCSAAQATAACESKEAS